MKFKRGRLKKIDYLQTGLLAQESSAVQNGVYT